MGLIPGSLPCWKTIEQARELLTQHGIRRSPRTFYRWLQEGKLLPRSKRLRDGWLVMESDIIAIIENPSLLADDADEPIERPVRRRGIISRGIL